MRILHVTPSFYPATYYGGPIYSLLGLCNAQSKSAGNLVRVLTTDAAGPGQNLTLDRRTVRLNPACEVHYCRCWGARDFSPELAMEMKQAVAWAEVVHLHGVFCYSTIPTLVSAAFAGKALLWSPHGSLRDWAFHKRTVAKGVWMAACRSLAPARRFGLHAASNVEAAEGRRHLPAAPVFIVGHGVEMPIATPHKIWQPGGRTRLMYIGRLSPEKGLVNLIGAMSRLPDSYELSVFGTGDPQYVNLLQDSVQDQKLSGRVRFHGQAEGSGKDKAFFDADVTVAPSFSENFGMSIAESLAYGVPVVASKAAPWEHLEPNGCGLWVDNDPASLAKAIVTLARRPLAEMGVVARHWMAREFQWHTIAQSMTAAYGQLVAS